MTDSDPPHDGTRLAATPAAACPAWCVTFHGVNVGEEDWVHQSEPLEVADGMLARLCMSIDPETGLTDGPYVLIGSREYTMAEAEAIGVSLVHLPADGSGATRPGAA